MPLGLLNRLLVGSAEGGKLPKDRWLNRDPGAQPGYKGPNMSDVQEEVGRRSTQLKNQGRGLLRRTAISALGGKHNTAGQRESANRLKAYSGFGPSAMKGMIDADKLKAPAAGIEKKQHAYDAGYAVGLLKMGSIGRVERKNAKMLKIAQLLHKKGKLTKKALYGLGEDVEYEPGRAEREADYSKMLESEAQRLEETDKPGMIAGWFGKKQPAKYQQMAADLRMRATRPMGRAGAAIPGKGAPSAATSAFKASPEQQKWLKSQGWSQSGQAARPSWFTPEYQKKLEAAGWSSGKKPQAGGPSAEEKEFYGKPKFDDIQQYYMQMLGRSPSQMRAHEAARETGYGRAMQHKTNLDWIRTMLMAPGAGHYTGTGG